jgi:hypothetical protein
LELDEMPTDNELERLAHAANALRPDWPVRSVLTALARDHTDRAYRDLAVALVAVATDPRTKTPARLAEAGPWWHAARALDDTATEYRFERCAIPGHGSYRADNCGACRSERIARDDAAATP